MQNKIKLNTVLLAKEYHPERVKGGSGVAIVIREPDESDFICIEWIESVINPYCPEDVASKRHLTHWYDVIDDNLKDQYVPKDWKSKQIVENILKQSSHLTKIK